MTEVHAMNDSRALLFRLRVAQFYGITVRELMSGKRSPRLLVIRHTAMWVLHTRYRLSYRRSGTIAGCSGGVVAYRNVESRRASDPVYAAELNELVRRLAAEIPPPPT